MLANKDRRTQGLRWGFEPICEVLQVSPSTVRSAIARPPCQRSMDDAVLKVQIKTDLGRDLSGLRCPQSPCRACTQSYRAIIGPHHLHNPADTPDVALHRMVQHETSAQRTRLPHAPRTRTRPRPKITPTPTHLTQRKTGSGSPLPGPVFAQPH